MRFLHLPLLPLENQRFVKLKVWHVSHKVVLNTSSSFVALKVPTKPLSVLVTIFMCETQRSL